MTASRFAISLLRYFSLEILSSRAWVIRLDCPLTINRFESWNFFFKKKFSENKLSSLKWNFFREIELRVWRKNQRKFSRKCANHATINITWQKEIPENLVICYNLTYGNRRRLSKRDSWTKAYDPDSSKFQNFFKRKANAFVVRLWCLCDVNIEML